MKSKRARLRFSIKAYRFFRGVVRCISVFAFLLLALFVVLRFYGVPDPVLREVVRRANVAGIPVDIERVTLTLRGWRAENVRYFSTHPDDLEPIFHAREVFIVRHWREEEQVEGGLVFDAEAYGIRMNPSIEWGIEIPAASNARVVDKIKVSLTFFPDRIEFADGVMEWVGSEFRVKGTILKADEAARERRRQKKLRQEKLPRDTVLPVYISEQQFQEIETRLKMIEIQDAVKIGINFLVDAGDYSRSRINWSVQTGETGFRGVDFSRMHLKGSYAYPRLIIERAGISRENRAVTLNGEYDFSSKQIQGRVANAITSKQLLTLLPPVVHDLLVKAEMQFDELPQFDLNLGPAVADGLLNSVSGSFEIRDVTYAQLEIASLKGDVSRRDDRLELTNLKGAVRGQEWRIEEMGSAMLGGKAEGEVYWDARRCWFGVKAKGGFDPNLLVGPLAPVEIATNVIRRFRFHDDRPTMFDVELGSCLTNWSTFFIDIHAKGNNVQIHDAQLSSVNVSGFYSNSVLRLDPAGAMQGVDFLKGKASLDFEHSTADVDMLSSISPVTLEDLVYPQLNLFGEHIRPEGNCQIRALGRLDWEQMKTTDFTAKVEVDKVHIPVACFDHLKADVSGKGTLLTVDNARFGLYGGKGTGSLLITLDPATNGIPYKTDASVENANFKSLLLYLKPDCSPDIAGELSGRLFYEADLKTNFFESANGACALSIVDGQLADLPLFQGFSRLMRKVIPGFNVFSITSLQGDFMLVNGTIQSDEVSFGGDIISAKGHGSYSYQTGFDAYVHARLLRSGIISKVVRAVTDPIFKLFELKLEGSLSEPSWKLDKFTIDPSEENPPPKQVAPRRRGR